MNPGGRPPRENAAIEDLSHPQDMKNPGQDGYRPATQASLPPLHRHVSHRARMPLRVMASAGAAMPRRTGMPRRAVCPSQLPARAAHAGVRRAVQTYGKTAFAMGM